VFVCKINVVAPQRANFQLLLLLLLLLLAQDEKLLLLIYCINKGYTIGIKMSGCVCKSARV